MSWVQRLFGTNPKQMNVDEVDSILASAIEQGVPLSIPDRIHIKAELAATGVLTEGKIRTVYSGYRGAVRAHVIRDHMTINEVRAEAGLPSIVNGDDIPYLGTPEQAKATATAIRNKSIVSKTKRSIVIRKDRS